MSRTARLSAALALTVSGCAISPDDDRRNRALEGVAPLRSASELEVVLELDRPPGNLAIGPDGRVYFTLHPEAAPTGAKVAAITSEGVVPFPDAQWQRERDDQPWFRTPLALRTDGLGRLWVLDHGDYASDAPSLTAFDLATRTMVHHHELGDHEVESGGMLNDLVVDAQRGFIYIADTSAFEFDPAIIVYDIAQQTARRVLEDHPSVSTEDHHVVVQGRFMTAFGLPLQLDVDTIALSPDGEWLYYGPLTGATLWRVPTAALRDVSLSEEALGAKVEAWSRKPTTDGAVCGPDGAVYLTAIEHDAIAVARDGALTSLVQDAELLAWPDGLAVSPDGQWLYATCSELHHVIGQDLDGLPLHRPFRIVRLRLGKVPTSAGE